MIDQKIPRHVQSHYEEWLKNLLPDYHNWIGFHLPILNLNELFQTRVGTYLHHGVSSIIDDKIMVLPIWIWDYVFSILKCREKGYISFKHSNFLLEHIYSNNDYEKFSIGIALIETEEMLELFKRAKLEEHE